MIRATPSLQDRFQNKIALFTDIAKDLGIRVKVYDDEGTALKFSDGKIQRIVYGFSFGINGAGEARVCVDKAMTATVLREEGVPHIPHVRFHRGKTKEESWPRISDFANRLNHPFDLVCKPLKGEGGIDVNHTNNAEELEAITDELFKRKSEIVLSPFYPIEDEYRVIMLNHGVEYIFRKERRFVIGDGVSTIETLIARFGHKLDKKSGISTAPEFLKQQPSLGQKVYITWKHNGFTAHRIPVDSPSPLQERIRNVASRSSKALNMAFCCVDIVKIQADDQPRVLEVNSDVWVEEHEVGYEDVKRTYTKVIVQLMGKQERCCARVQRLLGGVFNRMAGIKTSCCVQAQKLFDGILDQVYRKNDLAADPLSKTV